MTVVVDVKYDEIENSMEIDLSGDDMGVLIGKRGETSCHGRSGRRFGSSAYLLRIHVGVSCHLLGFDTCFFHFLLGFDFILLFLFCQL